MSRRLDIFLGDVLPVTLLLLAFLGQALLSLPLMSATTDEPNHLTAGYEYVHTGKIRLNREHPPLMKQLCALPLALFIHPTVDFGTYKGEDLNDLKFSQEFLYSNDANRMMLFWARLPVVLLGVFLGFFVYLWTRELFGSFAGLLALTLYAFCPNIIAHSRFVTMDLGLTCFAFITFYWLWKYWRKRMWRYLVLAGISYGLTLGAKYSAVLFAPVMAILTALIFLIGEKQEWRIRVVHAAAAGLVVFGLAGLIVWALFYFPSDPLFYWKGIRLVNSNHNPDYPFYLNGEFRIGGWPHYFLFAMLYKTPAPALFIFFLSLLLFHKTRASHWMDDIFLWLPAVFFFVMISAMADNIGLRYVLPVFPFLIVFCGRLGQWAQSSSKRMVLLGCLCLLQVVSVVRVFPDYIAYFNELAGGPANGWKLLHDSNLDWGQDLPRLKKWMDQNEIQELKLLYPWSASPEYHGIKWVPLANTEWHVRPEPTIYAISIQHLVMGLWEAETYKTRSDWLHRYKPVDQVGYSFFIYDFRGDGPSWGGN